jgi:hypothetical protein
MMTHHSPGDPRTLPGVRSLSVVTAYVERPESARPPRGDGLRRWLGGWCSVACQVYGTTLLPQARDHLGALEPVGDDLARRLAGRQGGVVKSGSSDVSVGQFGGGGGLALGPARTLEASV